MKRFIPALITVAFLSITSQSQALIGPKPFPTETHSAILHSGDKAGGRMELVNHVTIFLLLAAFYGLNFRLAKKV